jgi:hypothetical protein
MMRIVSRLFRAGIALLAAPAAGAAGDSCFVPADAARTLSGASVEAVDKQLAVLRPCAGKVAPGGPAVEVTFSTGAGYSQRTRVAPGELVQERVRAAAGPGKTPVDIWPKRALLTAALDLLNGRPTSLSGTSGFESADGSLPIGGEVLPLPDTRLALKLHRWDPAAPVSVAQAGWSAQLVPQDGVIALPVQRLKAGELKLTQGQRQARLTVVPLQEVGEVVAELKAIDAQGGDAAQRAARRALLLQENQLQINALSELFSRR